MKTSLSGRVAFGLVAQVVVFAGALGYLVFTADALFDDLSALKDDLEPTVEDLRTLQGELKSYEDLLVGARPADLERVRDWLPRARVFDRLQAAAATLRRLSESDRVGPEVASDLSTAATRLEELTVGDRLVAGAAKTRLLQELAPVPRTNEALWRAVLGKLVGAVASGQDAEAEVAARELLRLERYVRATALEATQRAIAGLREANHAFFQQRSDLSLALIAVAAGAMVVALVVLLLSLRALRPVGDLAQAVRRLSAGDYGPVTLPGTREFADLARALNSLAEVLRTRESEGEKRKEEQMRTERLAVVGRMASVVAHEVRNPLNSIALNVDLLHEMLLDPDRGGQRAPEVLGAVQREVDRLAEITEDYLRFGRLPKGVLSAVDLGRVVRETREFMSGEFQAAGLEVVLQLPDAPLRVVCDEGQLRQALINVLRNAVEATEAGGTITITGEAEGDRGVLAVTDTGAGIPEAFKARLFEPFATTKPRGTGLGLAFVQQVAQESGGEVGIDSTPGQGTTVRMRLRVAKDRAPSQGS